MTDTTVLVTGCGAPGTIGTLWALARNPDGQSIRTVGTDVRAEQAGRFVCDEFRPVPAADEEGFVEAMVDIAEAESVDVVLPQVTAELGTLSANLDRFEDIGTRVAVSGHSCIERANHKGRLASIADRHGVPTPETVSVSTRGGLRDAAARFGYPDTPFVVKPPDANGQRGFRVVTEPDGGKAAFYEQKPSSIEITLDRLEDRLGEAFPELLAMEYLPGEEFTVDAFRDASGTIVVPRTRDQVRSGISFHATLVDDEALTAHVETLAAALDLRYAFGFQFKRSVDGTLKLLECNPRVQGTMVASALGGANLVYAAVQSALERSRPTLTPAWGTRLYRYWGGLGVGSDGVVGNIGSIR